VAEVREMASKKVSEYSYGFFMPVYKVSDFVCIWLNSQDRDEY
jgi:hypothetical protein